MTPVKAALLQRLVLFRHPLRLTAALLVLLLIAACAPAAAPTPTATLVPPTATPEPPTATPEPPTATPEPPTATPEPTAEPAPVETGGLEGEGDVEAGQLIASLAQGCGCHFNRDLGGLAGGNDFSGNHGTLYASNITPDEETGIGSWTDDQIAASMRLGLGHFVQDPAGLPLFPAMPYRDWHAMADDDLLNLIAYLRSLDPIANQVPARELAAEPARFEPAGPSPAMAPTEGIERGEYLVTIVRCTRCHTLAGSDASMYLAGAPFRDTVASNLTPDDETGLGQWTEQEIADFLGTGVYADGTEAIAAMKGLAEGTLSRLPESDRLAIATFLKSLPPVANQPGQ